MEFLGLILGATGSIYDMSACLGLIAALADDFFALPRGSLGQGGGRTFPRDAAAMAAAVLSSGKSGAGFLGRWVFGDWWQLRQRWPFPFDWMKDRLLPWAWWRWLVSALMVE